MANLKVTENPVAFMPFTEHVDPSNPAAGGQRLFVDTDHLLKMVDSSGTVTTFTTSGAIANPLATDSLWDAAGDLVQGTGANTAAKLTAGSAGQTLKSAGAAAANLWAYPPGYEVAYAQSTSNATINTTTEGTAVTVVATSSATYENVPYMVEIFSPRVDLLVSGTVVCNLFVDSTILGRIALFVNGSAANSTASYPIFAKFRYTPSAGSHTFTWSAHEAGGATTIYGGAGGTGTNVPAYIRVVKV